MKYWGKMFKETDKYKINGHFFFEKGDILNEVSIDVPNRPGIFYIIKLAKGRVELVYIGKSGTIHQNGKYSEQLLRDRINNKQDGVLRQQFFDKKIEDEHIDALDIYWFVTEDDQNSDIPEYVKGLLLQRYYELYKKLPLWHKEY